MPRCQCGLDYIEDKYPPHLCYLCMSCQKYYDYDSSHVCKLKCKYCDYSYSKSVSGYSHDKIILNPHECVEKAQLKMQNDIKEIKASLKEILDILKFGPMSQMYIESKNHFENVSSDTHFENVNSSD